VPNLSFLAENADRLLLGAGTTILLSFLACVAALIIGTAIGATRWLAPRSSWLLRIYVDVVRATPLLIQMYLIYYALPGFGVTLDAFPSALVALTMNSSAYISEIVRAAVLSVPRSQVEAAESLGMSRRRTIPRVVVPQALIVAIPPLAGEFIDVIKWSSVASIVVVSEITQVATTIVGRSFSFSAFVVLFLLTTCFYLALTSVVSAVARRLEARVSRHLVSHVGA
jgi:cystine transport system permease protein